MPSTFALRVRSVGRKRGRGPGAGLLTRPRIAHPYWTTPLAANAPVAATSADLVSRLAYQAQMSSTSTPVKGVYAGTFRTNTDQANYSHAIYRLPENTPRVPVYSIDNKGGGWRDILNQGVPIPDPSQLADGTIAPLGTDGSVIFLCGYEMWEMWKFIPAEVAGAIDGGYQWQCRQGGYVKDIRTWPGWFSASGFFGGGSGGRPSGQDWGVGACGLSYWSAVLTTEDYAAGVIQHPLALALPICGGNTARGDVPRVFPATRSDANAFVASGNAAADIDALRVPQGSRFRLPANVWTNSAIAAYAAANGVAPGTEGRPGSTAEVLVMVLTALRDYGMIITDTSGVVGFAAEHTKTYGTSYHPNHLPQPKWGNFGQQLPWDQLVQVEPLTVDISAPGPGYDEGFTDNFTRANSATTGGLWHEWDTGAGQHPIVGNQMSVTASTAAIYWNVAPFYQTTTNHYVEMDVAAVGASGTAHPGIAVRFNERFPNAYLCRYGTTGWDIIRIGGSGGSVANVTATAPALPYRLRVEAQGADIRVYCNGSLVVSGTDTTFPSGGGVAVGMRWNASADETQRVDNFAAGAL